MTVPSAGLRQRAQAEERKLHEKSQQSQAPVFQRRLPEKRRTAETPKSNKKNKRKKREKPRKRTSKQKIPVKQNACVSKGLARKAANRRNPKKRQKNKRKKREKPRKRTSKQKIPVKQNACVSKGLARKAANRRNPKKARKKQRKKSKKPKSFFDNFWPLPAAASCPSGKTVPPSRHQPKQRKLQMRVQAIPSLKQSSLARLHGKALYFCRSANVVSLFSSAGRACAS